MLAIKRVNCFLFLISFFLLLSANTFCFGKTIATISRIDKDSIVQINAKDTKAGSEVNDGDSIEVIQGKAELNFIDGTKLTFEQGKYDLFVNSIHVHIYRGVIEGQVQEEVEYTTGGGTIRIGIGWCRISVLSDGTVRLSADNILSIEPAENFHSITHVEGMEAEILPGGKRIPGEELNREERIIRNRFTEEVYQEDVGLEQERIDKQPEPASPSKP